MTVLMCPRCGNEYEPPVQRLTPKQHDVLSFVADYIDDHGYAPSIEEIADGLGLRSLAGVHEHLTNVQRKGWIHRRYNEARSIDVIVRPNAAALSLRIPDKP